MSLRQHSPRAPLKWTSSSKPCPAYIYLITRVESSHQYPTDLKTATLLSTCVVATDRSRTALQAEKSLGSCHQAIAINFTTLSENLHHSQRKPSRHPPRLSLHAVASISVRCLSRHSPSAATPSRLHLSSSPLIPNLQLNLLLPTQTSHLQQATSSRQLVSQALFLHR
jgi:hypothetical protein